MDESVLYPNALCGVIIDDYLWFMNHVANALMKMRISDGVIEEWYLIEPYDILQSCLFLNMKFVGKTIILIPDVFGKHIVWFDPETKMQERIDVEEKWLLSVCFQQGDKLIFVSKFPSDDFHIVCLDAQKKELRIMEEWERIISEKIPEDIKRNELIASATSDDANLWILIKNTGHVLKFNYKELNCKRFTFTEDTFGKIVCGNNGVFLSSAKAKKLYFFDNSGYEGLKEWIDLSEGECSDNYASLSSHGDKILCLPYYDSIVDIIDENTKEVFRVDLDTKENKWPIESRKEYSFYNFGHVSDENRIIILPHAGKDFFIFEKKTGKTDEIFPKNLYEFKKTALTFKGADLFMLESEKQGIKQFVDLMT